MTERLGVLAANATTGITTARATAVSPARVALRMRWGFISILQFGLVVVVH
jgi:hypothetical protein